MRLVLGILLPIMLATLAQAAPDWQEMPPDKFRALPELNARIDFAHYDRELMAAAIFHESNRMRRRFGQSALRHLSQLDEAADSHARIGALLPGNLSHHNPVPALADAMDRVHAAGLNPQLVAENIALITTLDWDSKAISVGVRTEGDRRVFYELATNRMLQPQTYAAFAVTVVKQWLDSPGHRANLLNPNLECLGCSARWCKDPSGMDLLYSVQVFCTP